MRKLRHMLTRIHLWIGEMLGLTRYRNCHDCIHCVKEVSEPSLIWCNLYFKEDGVLAVTDPCEAVWCDEFAEKGVE